jgi:hypothetical protein
MEDVWKALAALTGTTTIGNPLKETVRMGSLAGQSQNRRK